ncbi:hypothetical protein R6Q57_019800 [Mikania cordata]
MEESNKLIHEYEDFASSFLPNLTSFDSNMISSVIITEFNRKPQGPVVNYSPSFISNNSSTSDETDESSMIINERKHRRMISNRESARRSRVRKQRQLNELFTQMARLTNENQGLMTKLNRFLEFHEEVLQENDKLKNEILELKKLLSEVQLDNTYTTLGDLIFFRGRSS